MCKEFVDHYYFVSDRLEEPDNDAKARMSLTLVVSQHVLTHVYSVMFNVPLHVNSANRINCSSSRAAKPGKLL